ncbi:hypothetical protein [Pontiella agarivorans]|uniref:Lipoprotein n=1 Tax=Pontiella agarivorans TaxID=3038953 RepID=A0ABU5N193_9BACT|nr:hypothetical protein [Pontiella agarivorans]MDZ8120207.1 hypothetical protein [Pontiella agarivorans]
MKLTFLFLAPLFLIGCGTTQTYDGPKRPSSELATIEAVRYVKMGMPSRMELLLITECNGKTIGTEFKGYPKTIDVLPGQTRIKLFYRHNLDKSLWEVANSTGVITYDATDGQSDIDLGKITFCTQAGHDYKLMFHPALLTGKLCPPALWVVDLKTKKIIYGSVPQEIKDPANIQL